MANAFRLERRLTALVVSASCLALALAPRQKMAPQPLAQPPPETAAPSPRALAERAAAPQEPADEPTAALRAAARRLVARRVAELVEFATAVSKQKTAIRRCSLVCCRRAVTSPACSTPTASTSKPPAAATIARCRSRTARRAPPSPLNWQPLRRPTARPAHSLCCPVRRSLFPQRDVSPACASSSRLRARFGPSSARGGLGRRDRA
jgi:hypothetical protein